MRHLFEVIVTTLAVIPLLVVAAMIGVGIVYLALSIFK